MNKDFEIKSETELEAEARESTLNSLDELYSFIDDRQRKDWFAVFMNAVVVEFDPHTYYFAPEAKERFDVDMTGNYEGIGARLQKKNGLYKLLLKLFLGVRLGGRINWK